MTASNFAFFSQRQQRLDQANLQPLNEIHSVEIEWRHQKNFDEEQKIPYTRNRPEEEGEEVTISEI